MTDTYFGGPLAFAYEIRAMDNGSYEYDFRWESDCENESEQRLSHATVSIKWEPEFSYWGTFEVGALTSKNTPGAFYVDNHGFSLRPTIGSLGAGVGGFWSAGNTWSSEPVEETRSGWWLNHCESPTWATSTLKITGARADARISALPTELVHLETMQSDYYSFSAAGTFVKDAHHTSASAANRTLIVAMVWNRGAPDPPPRFMVTHNESILFDGPYDEISAFEIPEGRVTITVPSIEYPGALQAIFWLVDERAKYVCAADQATSGACQIEMAE